jgi:hypothetical protein
MVREQHDRLVIGAALERALEIGLAGEQVVEP